VKPASTPPPSTIAAIALHAIVWMRERGAALGGASCGLGVLTISVPLLRGGAPRSTSTPVDSGRPAGGGAAADGVAARMPLESPARIMSMSLSRATGFGFAGPGPRAGAGSSSGKRSSIAAAERASAGSRSFAAFGVGDFADRAGDEARGAGDLLDGRSGSGCGVSSSGPSPRPRAAPACGRSAIVACSS